MPLYEFQCDECGHRFEIIQQKFSDPPPAACPQCGGTVRKLVSSPAFQFKGSGWYVTDYAKKDGAKTAKTDGGSADGGKEKADKADKSDKSDKADKTDKTTSAGDAAKTPSASSSSSKDGRTTASR